MRSKLIACAPFGYFCPVKTISAPFVLLWKGWFYFVVLVVILLIFPFIWYWSRRPGDYPHFFRWARIWSHMVLRGSFLHWRVKRLAKEIPQQCIIVSNHSSMLDIPLNMVLVPRPFLFIGKVELAKLPLFGFFYRRTNILVDRSSMRSRKEALEKAAMKLDEGYSMCIYPEGGVPAHDVPLGKFKEGAFRLATEKQIPLLPITFVDNKLAYPYRWNLGGPRLLRCTIHPPIEAKNKGAKELKTELRSIFEQELAHYGRL